MLLHGHILDFPGVARSLSYPVEDGLEGAAATAVATDAISAFAPLFRPMSIDVLLRAYHRDTGEPVALVHPYWYAATADAQSNPIVGPSTNHAVCRQVDAITPATITALIEEAITAEKLAPEIAWTWSEMRMYTAEVRLPDSLASRKVLSLGVTGGDTGADVEVRGDGSWVNSARQTIDEPPLTLKMSTMLSVLQLEISTYWSLWAPGGPGEPDLNAVFDALMARGWVRCP